MLDINNLENTFEVRNLSNSNQIDENLKSKKFFWTLEFVPSVDKVLKCELDKLNELFLRVQNSPLVAGFSVADRVHSDRDPDSIAAASQILLRTKKQPLVHLSGKGKEAHELSESINRLTTLGLKNVLVLTGDKLKEQNLVERNRYLESVPAIQIVKKTSPSLNIAVAFNPFKYREEDCMAQYLKLEKKIGAGANYIITQIGFDHRKYQELADWKLKNDINIPAVGNVMLLYARGARYMRKHQLAGVTVSNGFLQLLEFEEKLPDKGVDRALRRLALQIIQLKNLGYAGVQLTGIHSYEMLIKLEAKVDELSALCVNEEVWGDAWNECMCFPDGVVVDSAPKNAWYMSDLHLASASAIERYKFWGMKMLHTLFFSKGPMYYLFALILAPVKDRHGTAGKFLEKFERVIKKPLVGCDTCGNCRLEYTQYICPESCPKGLANGPCGGTSENLCEFRDRECIHSVKYRIAKNGGDLNSLKLNLISTIPKEIRHTSSYPAHFSGHGIKVTVIKSDKR